MSFTSVQAEVSRLTDRVYMVVDQSVRGGAGGQFNSRSLGSSVDFHDHRVYQPGDDPRHLNWNAYARTDVPMMKTFVEEVSPMVDLVLDLSASMHSPGFKQQRYWEWISFVSASFTKQGARLKYFDLSGELPSGDWESFEKFVSSEPQKVTHSQMAGDHAFRAHSIRIVLSDLLTPEDPSSFLANLAHRAGAALILCPFTQTEENPPWNGNYEFEDSESGLVGERRITEEVLEHYQKAYDQHFALWEEICGQFGISLWRQPVEMAFIILLQTELAQPWVRFA